MTGKETYETSKYKHSLYESRWHIGLKDNDDVKNIETRFNRENEIGVYLACYSACTILERECANYSIFPVGFLSNLVSVL